METKQSGTIKLAASVSRCRQFIVTLFYKWLIIEHCLRRIFSADFHAVRRRSLEATGTNLRLSGPTDTNVIAISPAVVLPTACANSSFVMTAKVPPPSYRRLHYISVAS